MRSRAFVLALVIALLALAIGAMPALAGQQTGIMYALENTETFTYTPASTGLMTITLSWTRPDGTGVPVYPESEVDAVVQTEAFGEPYYDIDIGTLYEGTNPELGSYTVKASAVGKPIYITVLPWVGDVPYRLVVTFAGSTVIDTGAINVASPTQKWAYASAGELYIPSAGSWHSVCQYWQGTMNRTAGTSDVWANWDDYAWGRDAGTEDYELANNWAGLEYYPPVVSDGTISASGGGPASARPGYWYTIAPEIWTSAARPNVWNAIATDLYAKPGSLAYNAAPMWYTYSWPDDAKPNKIAYFWSSVPNLNASQHSFSGDASTVANIKGSFYGTGVTWVYRTGTQGGRANVYIDGSATPHNALPIELYSPATQYKQQYVVSGLSNAAHTIEIRNVGTRHASSGSYFIYHDAFWGKTDVNDPTPTQENNTDGQTVYDWARVSNANASGGSFSGNPSTTAAAAYTFTGTSVSLIYRTGSLGGKADVYIDGVFQETVEMYSAASAYQLTKTWSGLTNSMHTIFVKNNGQRHAASGSYYVYIDAFQVGATKVEN